MMGLWGIGGSYGHGVVGLKYGLAIVFGHGDVGEGFGFLSLEVFELEGDGGTRLVAHVSEKGDEVFFEAALPVAVGGFGGGDDLVNGDVVEGEQLIPGAVDLDFGGVVVPADGLEGGD